MRGVRKEIKYSEPCSNATDKAQLSLGCIHLNTCSLCSLVLKWVQPNSTVLYLGHLSTVRNNLFLKHNTFAATNVPPSALDALDALWL